MCHNCVEERLALRRRVAVAHEQQNVSFSLVCRRCSVVDCETKPIEQLSIFHHKQLIENGRGALRLDECRRPRRRFVAQSKPNLRRCSWPLVCASRGVQPSAAHLVGMRFVGHHCGEQIGLRFCCCMIQVPHYNVGKRKTLLPVRHIDARVVCGADVVRAAHLHCCICNGLIRSRRTIEH